VWFLGYFLFRGVPPVDRRFFFPLVLACLFPLLLGVGWLLVGAGSVRARHRPAHRDALARAPLPHADLLQPGCRARALHGVLLANPLTFIVEQLRQVLFFGQLPSVRGLTVYPGMRHVVRLAARGACSAACARASPTWSRRWTTSSYPRAASPKCYRVFDNTARADAHAMWPRSRSGMQEVWALRDIDLDSAAAASRSPSSGATAAARARCWRSSPEP
jgi:hypothetical protein